MPEKSTTLPICTSPCQLRKQRSTSLTLDSPTYIPHSTKGRNYTKCQSRTHWINRKTRAANDAPTRRCTTQSANSRSCTCTSLDLPQEEIFQRYCGLGNQQAVPPPPLCFPVCKDMSSALQLHNSIYLSEVPERSDCQEPAQ